VEGVGDHGCEYMTGGRVAVLGATGINFGAGMSGGIAWVLDRDGELEGRCNTELVDLEPVGDEESVELHDLVAEHLARTGSVLASELLADWDAWCPRFTQVMPRGYRRALHSATEPHAAEATA